MTTALIKTTTKLIFIFFSLFIYICLASCKSTQIPCPKIDNAVIDTKKTAQSAGCMAIYEGKLLVIQNTHNKLSIPGGSSENNEPAYCTAHRETWEETGLNLLPTKLVNIRPNGFHIYLCDMHDESGAITITNPLEAIDVKWLDRSQFNNYQWRFPDQYIWLKQWLDNHYQTEK